MNIDFKIVQGALDENHLNDIIKEEHVKIVAFSSSTFTYPQCVKLNRAIKRENNDMISVIGGCHVTYLPNDAITDGFDYVFCFEGDLTFPKVINDLLNENKVNKRIIIPKSYVTNLDELPIVKPSIFDKEVLNDINIGMCVTSRGCNQKCSFCVISASYNRWRCMSAARVLKEVKFQLNELKLKSFGLFDANVAPYPNDIQRLAEIAKGLDEMSVKYVMECRADLISYLAKKDPKTLDKICNNLFLVCIGLESGSKKNLKNFQKNLRLSDVEIAINALKDRSVIVKTCLMFGALTETSETLKETKNFIFKTTPDIVAAQVITPYPGTRIFRELESSGAILTHNWSKYDTSTLVFKHPNFTEKDFYSSCLGFVEELRRGGIVAYTHVKSSDSSKPFKAMEYGEKNIEPDSYFRNLGIMKSNKVRKGL